MFSWVGLEIRLQMAVNLAAPKFDPLDPGGDVDHFGRFHSRG